MDKMHFIDYAKGELPNQERLCDHLRKKGKFGIIEDDKSNPMTIRLLLAREGLDQIIDFCNSLNNSIKDQSSWETPDGYTVEPFLAHSTAASGCVAYTPTLKIDPQPKFSVSTPWKFISYQGNYHLMREDTSSVYLFNFYKGLYVYFTNFGSSLDRIRYEIEKLYNCPSNLIEHWSRLTKSTNKTIFWFNSQGWSNLTRITTSARSIDITKCCQHRHRLVHDGFLLIKVSPDKYRVEIPDDPENPVCWNEASSFCEKKFRDLIVLLNDIYDCMVNDV
jgi:hypothetical protein